MRRGFVALVLAFGALAATLVAACLRVAMAMPWPQVLRAWPVLFAALALFPLGYGHLGVVRWLFRPRGPIGRPPRPTGRD